MIYVLPSASMFSQMTVVLILTGMVNSMVEDFTTCERALNRTVRLGTGPGVTVQASCYPNGTVSYNWNADPSVWYLQIEYQCYINGTTHEQTPNPVTKEEWSTITNGDGTLIVRPWEEGTLCILSGCYESRDKGYPLYVIPNTTCTSMTAEVLGSPHLPMSATPLSSLQSYTLSQQVYPSATPLSSLQPIPSYTLLKQVSATPTVHPTPMLITQPPPRMVTETSIVMTPNTTNPSEHSITVTVVLVLITLMAVCPVSILVVTFIKRARPKARPTFVFDEKLIGDYPPISLSSYKPTQVSQETLLNVLEKPCPRDYFVSCENTSQIYVTSVSEDASFSNSINELSEQSNIQDNHSGIAKPADSSDDVAGSASTSTQTAKANSSDDVADSASTSTQTAKVNSSDDVADSASTSIQTAKDEEEEEEEEKDEENKEKVEEVEDEIEDGRRKEMHFELLSEHIACTEEKSATYESLDCIKHLPVGNFSHCIDEPFTLNDNEPAAHSVSVSCIDGDPVPYVPSCSSESSGYVSHFTWNSGKQLC